MCTGRRASATPHIKNAFSQRVFKAQLVNSIQNHLQEYKYQGTEVGKIWCFSVGKYFTFS